MPRYEVPIVYRGQVNFIIEASNEDAAREAARARFNAGDKEDALGNEWETIERFGEVSEVAERTGCDYVIIEPDPDGPSIAKGFGLPE